MAYRLTWISVGLLVGTALGVIIPECVPLLPSFTLG